MKYTDKWEILIGSRVDLKKFPVLKKCHMYPCEYYQSIAY